MTGRVIRPAIVDEDLAGLAQHIARDNVEAALRFLEAAELAFQKLAEMPGMAGLWESPNLVWQVFASGQFESSRTT
jgi:plasmid stabilization system protein ParE